MLVCTYALVAEVVQHCGITAILLHRQNHIHLHVYMAVARQMSNLLPMGDSV